jgi:hypothetical protein
MYSKYNLLQMFVKLHCRLESYFEEQNYISTDDGMALWHIYQYLKLKISSYYM